MDLDVELEDPNVASVLRVLGAGAVLVGLLGAVLFLAFPRGGGVAATDVLGELFAGVDEPLPFALRADGARALPTGARVVTFSRVDGAGDVDPSAPAEVTLVEFPARSGEKIISEQFRSLRFEGGSNGRGRGRGRGGPPAEEKKGEGDAKPKLQEKARFVWHGYDATYARMRHGGDVGAPKGEETDTERDGRDFYDTIRVDLSTGGRCIIAYVRFPDGVDGDKDVAAELVRAFRPRG
ncbi:MAG: hypothetical protein AAF726_00530 [Planctomycetota bacterium]